MSTSAVVAVVVVVVLLAAAALLAVPLVRRRRLRGKFGSEYDRAVERHGDRAEAEKDLRERERRHAQLELRPLSADARAAYTQRWSAVQARFVDEPQRAVQEADVLIAELMAERGYPAAEPTERAELLSVEHPQTIGDYRVAHDTQSHADSDRASTEQLREAMVKYRATFAELLGTGDPFAANSATDTHLPSEAETPRHAAR